MQAILTKHKEFWVDRSYISSAAVSILVFFCSLCINYLAIFYSIEEAGNSTTDILLQNLPVMNTDIIFSEGALMFVIFINILFMFDPKLISFTLKSVALFICTRSVFVIMTHLGPPAGHIVTDLGNLGYVSLGADLFFSGHTGLPFLMALLFWDNWHLRYLFFISTFLAAAAVILGHLHYSIDVFSAFFITHGIYLIAKRFFARDYKIFMRSTLFKVV